MNDDILELLILSDELIALISRLSEVDLLKIKKFNELIEKITQKDINMI